MILNDLPWKRTEIIVIFEIACKYCILDSFVDHGGYSISSKVFLPTVVYIMIIWVKFTQSILVCWFLECQRSLSPSLVWPLPICLDSWTCHSRSYAILLFTALDLASITSHIHNWVLFLLWLCLLILSGVISLLISSSILGTYWLEKFIFQCPFCLFILFMGFSGQDYWSGLQSPSPVDPILLEPVHLGWPYMTWLIVSLS